MTGSSGLAYKAYEIEELVDIYFFRRLGYLVAHAARLSRLTPNAVSIVAALVGMAGGVLLYWPRLALAGFGLLILHGIVDSADGQLLGLPPTPRPGRRGVHHRDPGVGGARRLVSLHR